MARQLRPPQNQEPPADWTPTQAVDDPVINKPYDEPMQYWKYSKDGIPSRIPGRRPASYFYKTQQTGTVQQDIWADEQSDELPLVNRLRDDVKRWREKGYRGASAVTRDLLNHWSWPDRHRRLFFCQREAVETIIYLLEIAIPGRLPSTGFKNFEVDGPNLLKLLAGQKPDFQLPNAEFFPRLIDAASDASLLPLRRLGCKMATGSGKTIVMAMLIAWAFCNRGRNPATTIFPNGVLICAPNLTVKNRLQVLRPDDPNNYYDLFDLVPAKYRELMGAGRVLVTNWHVFAPRSPGREGDATYRVVDKGEETNEAFARNRLGELTALAPVLVLNDEGHHCWRPKPGVSAAADKGLTAEEKKQLEEEAEEARVWLAGLDRINNSGLAGKDQGAILACVDLSATPFYLGNSGYPEGSPFPWLVNDFGLVDAIESGIVKIPRLPVRDDSGKQDDVGRPDPKFYRLWRHIDDKLRPADRLANGRPKPDRLYQEAESALTTLASQWKQRFDSIKAASPTEEVIPPVLIVVCDNTDLAQIVYEKISGEQTQEVPAADGKSVVREIVYGKSAILADFQNSEGVKRSVRIDSKLLAKIETEEGETQDEAAQALRLLIGSIGKRGGPGEHVRCVVSVSMLTEGWDATNVTHILGIRAFGSQLLCEQVVGRGLRRMNYTPDPKTGLLPAEHVDVYGIPFSLIPYKGRVKDEKVTDAPYHHVFAIPERAALEIRMPVVESYTYDVRESGIAHDLEKMEPLTVTGEPTYVEVELQRGYRDAKARVETRSLTRQDRKEFYAGVRVQEVIFDVARRVVEQLAQGGRGPGVEALKAAQFARHQLFPEVVKIVQEYIQKKVKYAPGLDQRELALEKYRALLCERIRMGITAAAASKKAPLIPIVNSYKPYVSTADVNYRTTRPVIALTKSHINYGVVRSDWEREAIEVLEGLDFIEFYSPNDRNIGLVIRYEYLEGSYSYEPDFVVRIRNGPTVITEIKGVAGEIHDPDRVNAKNAAARKWVEAVSNAGRYGKWDFEICRDIGELRSILEKYAPETQKLPFRRVEPRANERFKTCVPLTSLRAAAGRWSAEQSTLDGMAEWAEEWIAFETSTQFEPGMFVAQVLGDSMLPEIPNGAYCLFRLPRPGSREGRKLLVMHSGVSDPHTGGQYTLKVYSSQKVQDSEGNWLHTKIVLKPLNRAYIPIELTPQNEGEVRVIAEFVEVI